MGLRNGLELRPELADSLAIGDRQCVHHCRLLGMGPAKRVRGA